MGGESYLGWRDPTIMSGPTLNMAWTTAIIDLQAFAQVLLPVRHPYQSLQWHGFSDASEKAYSAVVYVRTMYHDHPPVVSLVASKTKVAPLKPLTIPRLELCGETLLSKLLTSVSTALDVHMVWQHYRASMAWWEPQEVSHVCKE